MFKKEFELTPEAPFDGYYRADVFISSRDNRRMIRLYRLGGDRLTTTYSRYIFQVDYWKKYGKLIPDDLEVDHINEDKLDDALDNLQLLTHTDNIIKNNYIKGTMCNLCTCPVCGITFVRIQHKIKLQTIGVCSNICLRSLQMSKIGKNLSRYLSKYQVILTFRVYRKFPSGDEYMCQLVNKFNDCYHPNTLENAQKWLPETLFNELTFVDYSKRIEEISNMRKNGLSYRKIANVLGIDKNSVIKNMKNQIGI